MRIENAMQNENRTNEIEGFLFYIYNVEEEVHVWILDKEGKPHLFLDHYFPIIYLDGGEKEVRKIIKRIEEYKAFRHTGLD
jgi:metal-responsive CopG/Arc/MetJ family transcriptional regulator